MSRKIFAIFVVILFATACVTMPLAAPQVTGGPVTAAPTETASPTATWLPTVTPAPSPTVEPPTPTLEPTQEATALPGGAALPVVEAGATIGAENASGLVELGYWDWDVATLGGVMFVPGLDRVAVDIGEQLVLYDPQTGADRQALPGGKFPPSNPGFLLSPDGSLVAWRHGECPSESMRCRVEVARLAGGPALLTLEDDALSALAISADNRFLVFGGSQGLAVYSLEDGAQVALLPESLYFDRVAISPDGSRVAGCTYMSEFINIWRLPEGELVYRIDPEQYRGAFFPNNVFFSKDGKTLTAGANGLIGQWQVEDGKELRFWQPHNSEIGAMAFSPDEKLLVSGDLEGNLVISDAVNGVALHTFQGHAGWIWSVGFVGDGRLLVTFGGDGKVRVWGVGR